MMRRKNTKFKKGAASFYIVAFSTLILMIIATSFTMVVLSQVTRSENDDLSQSAYDSALAGVEDAKVAFSNYRRCKEAGKSAATMEPSGNGPITCEEIIYWMDHPDCYMVGHILGKIPKSEPNTSNPNPEVTVGGTTITSGTSETTTNQAYTCVQINTELNDYRTTLNQNKKRQTMRASAGNGATNDVDRIRISWYSVRSDITLQYSDYKNSRVVFPALMASTIATPPAVELQIVQTAPNFTLSQFNDTVISGSNSKTNRATLYLVPTDDCNGAKVTDNANYIGVAHDGTCTTEAGKASVKNAISAEQVAKTNNRTVMNKPFAVYCYNKTDAEFYCSADIELPGVIGSSGKTRSNNTFMLSVSLPYQQPDTDFSIELICSGGVNCGTLGGPVGDGSSGSMAMIKNSQVSIDSTGRANDLYRRVESRLETADTTFDSGYPYYGLQILGSGSTNKNMKVTYEGDFDF